MNGEVNAIGKFLRGLAVIVVVCAGLAALFYLMLALDPDEETAPALIRAVTTASAGAFVGGLYYALSEIIFLLDNNGNLMRKQLRQINAIAESKKSIQSDESLPNL